MINIRIQNSDVKKLIPKITVVGVGGAGGNAVNNMISAGLQGVDFLVCNTDAQALEGSLCDTRLQLGVETTGGLGAGARPEVGRGAAEESLDEVLGFLDGANMAFITAGMGGGTGTGAAPVIARAAREKGILTVGVVTKPFHFEGTLRMKMAEQGIEEMQEYVDTLIVIPNQNLFRVANEKTTFAEAFKMADGVLQSAVRGVTDLMVRPGDINLDFADIRSVMLEMGKAMMGTGEATGERRATESAEKAINNPLLDDVSMKGARAVIINVTGGHDMTLFEVDEACNRIREEVDPDANIIFGSCYDDTLEGVMRVSVVATGIDVAEARATSRPAGTGGQRPQQQQQQQQQVRRVERSQPLEVSTPQAYSPAPVRQEQVPAQPQVARTPPGMVMPPLPLNVRPVAPVHAPPLEVSAPVETYVEQVAVNAPAGYSSPVSRQAEPEGPEGRALRGTVYNDAFIPPQPVEADRRDAGYGPQLSARRVPEEPRRAEPVPAPSLTLNPPVPGASAAAAAQQRKRAPSLFERFTNQLLSHGEEEKDDGRTGRGSAGGGTGGRAPLQGSLNIDAPKPGAAEDELDIPAFLRRQAN